MPAKEAGQRIGIVMMATIFGMAIGGWMSGWIYDLTGSYAAAFLNGIAWNLLNIVAIGAVACGRRGAAPWRWPEASRRRRYAAVRLDNGQTLRDARG